MKIAMYGSGAAGSVFACYLKNGGADMILIDRYEAHMNKVNAEGMKFTVHAKREGSNEYDKIAAPLVAKGFTVTKSEVDPTYDDIETVLPGFRAYTSSVAAAEAEGKVDVIIYMTKATQLEAAIQDSLPVVGEDTIAVSLINGLGNDDNLFKVFPKNRCIIGSGVLGTNLPEPAHCISTPAGGVQMNFGGAEKDELNNKVCAYLLKCFKDGGCDAYWRDGDPGEESNIYKFIWKKVCVNATVNTVCAVLRLKIGEVENDEWGQKLFHGVINETCAVATAKGVPMSAEEFIAHDHHDIVTNIADYYPSMCQDMLFFQRQTEIDVLNGKIAEYGKELGIPCPTCDILTKVVHAIQNNYDKQYFKK
ncbi:MAG: 2-dehydropantoate 2-reductase [Oscillospiraceae bacterium]|nr:2-dehydropantoate 2-reductase [Oscillospiraceae bacterium]